MKKIFLTTLSLATALSLNAAVLATAGDITVTDEDIAPIIDAQSMQIMGGEVAKITDEQKKLMVDEFIKYKLLMKEAKASGIEKSDEFKKQLELAKESIIFDMWQGNEFKKLTINDDEVKKYYDENSNAFMKPEEFKTSHILVEDEKTAKDIIANLQKVKKEDLKKEFEKIAKEKSTDPSAKENGGDLGFARKGIFVKEFEDVAVSLKVGEVSKEPVKSQFGYHIIYKEAEKKAEKIPLDSIKDRLKESLKSQKFKENLDKKADDLFKKAKIEYKIPTTTKEPAKK